MDYCDRWNQNRVDWLYNLPRWPRLGPPAVKVGLIFGTFFQAEERELLSPSYEWLMETARLSRGTLSKALAELEREEFLVIERVHRYRNTYSMPFDGDRAWVPGSKFVESKI